MKEKGERCESEGKLSNWSEQIPDVKPLVSRKIQYRNRVAQPGLQTLDYNELPSKINANQSVFQRSLMPQFNDDFSDAMSGMLVTKNAKLQTMTQYDLIPEIIYNSLEIKLREMFQTIIGPTIQRQAELAK